MIAEGQVVLFRFPRTDRAEGKLRPALILRQLPGQFNDWLICMVSSQVHQGIPDFDEAITPGDQDFREAGLKLPSVIRISRLAVVQAEVLLGKIGEIDPERLYRIKRRLSDWLLGTSSQNRD